MANLDGTDNTIRDLILDILKSKIIRFFILALVIAPLLLELIVYLVTKGILFFAGEILLYYGSLVAFVGTVLLALVAWKQNNAAEETNKRLADANDKLIENEKMRVSPLFQLLWTSAGVDIEFNLANASQNTASYVVLSDLICEKIELLWNQVQ